MPGTLDSFVEGKSPHPNGEDLIFLFMEGSTYDFRPKNSPRIVVDLLGETFPAHDHDIV
jgi:hypothetical protein